MSSVALQSSTAATLARKGQTVTIVGTTGATYNTATGSAAGTAYNATAKAVPLPLSPYRQQNDGNIKQGDERLLLSGIDVNGAALAEPPLNSVITLADGVTKYTLIAVDPLHPDGTELLFDCVIRGNAG